MTYLEDFVAESNYIEGIYKVTQEEIAAHILFLARPVVEVGDLVKLVSVLQPDAELRCKASVPGVRVGNHIAPPSGAYIVGELNKILAMDDPYYQHVAYETLHPFTDGNGRSGRALWLKKMGDAPLGFLHTFYYQALEHSR